MIVAVSTERKVIIMISNKTKSNFTMIPNTVIRDNNLSATARFLLIFMLQLPETFNFSEQELANQTGEGLRSVQNALKELETYKYFHRVKDGNDTIYHVYEEPTEVGERHE